jgi:hypothetical protein
VVSAVLLAAAGCGAGSGQDCAVAEPALVKEVMAGARTDFRPTLADGSPGIFIDHLEVRESGVGQLPEKDRKLGADQLVVLLVSVVLGGEDASDGIGSFQGPVYFALDADGKLLGPAGAFTAAQFDLESPPDPAWLEWGDKVETSTLANELFGCVDPV